MGVRSTRKGHLLIKIGNSSKEPFTTKMTKTVKGMGKMQSVDWRVTFEIRGLDCLTQKEEVQQALKRKLKKPRSRKVTVLVPNHRGMKFAVLDTDPKEAKGIDAKDSLLELIFNTKNISCFYYFLTVYEINNRMWFRQNVLYTRKKVRREISD